MVCDVKTISNNGAIVERPGSRDVSIGWRKQTMDGSSFTDVSIGEDQCRKTSIANTRSGRQDIIGRPRSIFDIFVWVLGTQQ